MIEVPPFNGFMVIACATLHHGFRHLWVLMVNRLPVAALPIAALALAGFWLWMLHRCMPSMGGLLDMWI